DAFLHHCSPDPLRHISVEACLHCRLAHPPRHLLDAPGHPRLLRCALELGGPLNGLEAGRQELDQLRIDVVDSRAHFGKRIHFPSVTRCLVLLWSYNASTGMTLTMVRENEIREGEIAIEPPPPTDAGLVFVGHIRTPWTSRLMTPRHGRPDGPVCRIEI